MKLLIFIFIAFITLSCSRNIDDNEKINTSIVVHNQQLVIDSLKRNNAILKSVIIGCKYELLKYDIDISYVVENDTSVVMIIIENNIEVE